MSYLKAAVFILVIQLFFLSCDEDSENPVVSTDPSVAVTSPVNNQLVSDYVTVTASASDDVGVAKVEFYINAALRSTDAAEPYEYIWNSTNFTHGTNHSIYAVAYDTDNNSTGSSVITVTIDTTLGTPEAPVLDIVELSVSTHVIPVYWSKNSDGDFKQYSVYVDTNRTGEPDIMLSHISTVNDTTLDLENLLDNTTYRVQIEVEDIFGKKAKSNIVSETTLNAPPPQGSILLIANYADHISFSWNQVPMSDFSSYQLIRSDDSLFDLQDDPFATFVEYSTLNYDHYTTDTGSYYYFLMINDTTGEYSVSDYYYNNSETNYALNFSGSTYATIPYFSGLNLGDNYTLEAWVYQRTAGSYDRVIDKSPPDSPYLQYSLISGNYLGADICANGSPARYHAVVGVTLNEWHHIALSYESGLITYFIDGQFVDSDSLGITSSCSFATTLNIGRRKLFDEFYFNGIIDEVRVWNIVRTPAEVNSTYNKSLIGNEAGLVCYYNFNEGSGDSIGSPVGGNGYLGETSGVDSKDPIWILSTAPIQ